MELLRQKIETNTEPNCATGDERTGPRADVEETVPLLAVVGKLREDLAAERDARLRLAAEYDNYRRRTNLERGNASAEGKRELLEQMLTIADSLDIAIANLEGAEESVLEGVRMIRRRFDKVLEASGVTSFESRGEPFDPERHEAFDVSSGSTDKPGTVHRVMRRGYFWNDKLLRPALVVVAQ